MGLSRDAIWRAINEPERDSKGREIVTDEEQATRIMFGS